MNKILLILWIMAVSGLVSAQRANPVTDCYLFTNANIIVKPGQTLSKGSILVRKGVIVEVGNTITAPFDAKVIDADSMYIYPGFIDAFSYTALKEEEKDKKDKENKPASPGEATLAQSGFTPQRSSFDLINEKSGQIEAMRKEGFVLSHVVPKGYPMAGQGNLLLLKDDISKDNLLLKKDISSVAEMNANRGSFPSTLIGAMSKFREVYKNTELYLKNHQTYKTSPVGTTRPEMVSEYEGFSKVVQKTQPLFFIAKKPKEIQRAIALQKELGYQMVLCEVTHIAPIMGMVDKRTPILLSLELPKEIKTEEKKDSAKTETKTSEELAKEQRRKNSYEEIMQQAAKLSKAGFNIGFSTLNSKSGDILKNIRRLIKAGLTEDQALASITTTPAQLLNVSNILGSLEKGKMASFVIADKPIFDEKCAIRFTMVDGQLHEYKAEPKKETKPGDDKLNLAGTWRITVEVPGESQYGNLYVEDNGGNYKVGFEPDDKPGEVSQARNITFADNVLSFDVTIASEVGSMDVVFSVTFEDTNNGTGTASVAGFGAFKAIAEKRLKPDHNN